MGRMKTVLIDQVNQVMEDEIIEVQTLSEVKAIATEIMVNFGVKVLYRELAVGYDVCLWDEDFEKELFGTLEWSVCDVQ